MGKPLTIEIDGLDAIQEKIDSVRELILDFRPFYRIINLDFQAERAAVTFKQSPGMFNDLSDKYKITKARTHGFIYPILVAGGKLRKSLIGKSPDSVIKITKKDYVRGTKLPYAIYHHSKAPRKKIPRRPLWNDDPGSPMLRRWDAILESWAERRATEILSG